jgi:glycogen(starch) synthase
VDPNLEWVAGPVQWIRRPVRAGAPPIRLLNRRLHVLMVGWEFPPRSTGGLGVHCYELVQELAAMGHRVTFTVPTPGDYAEVRGVHMRWPTRRSGQRWFATYDPPVGEMPDPMGTTDGYNQWIAQLSLRESIDLIHVHDWFGTVGAVKLARRLRRPLVMTVHSTEYDRSLGHPWTEILEREKVGLAGADQIIAVSRHTKEQLVQRYGVAPSRVSVVYNAVRPTERVAQLDPTRPTVLYLGRLAAMKGVDTFLQAAARVASQHPNAVFVIAGEGPEFPRLLKLSAVLGLGDRVLFLGRVTEEERVGLLARTSVFVLPSVIEPFGITALEAMAAGIPTILSKTSGVAEVVGSAFVVDFWDVDEFASRMSELLAYPALSKTMGAAGRAEATQVGWAERALETARIYAELVQARGSSR